MAVGAVAGRIIDSQFSGRQVGGEVHGCTGVGQGRSSGDFGHGGGGIIDVAVRSGVFVVEV